MADEPESQPEYESVDGVDVHFYGTVLRCALDRPKTRHATKPSRACYPRDARFSPGANISSEAGPIPGS